MNPSEVFNAGIPAFGTWVLYAFMVAAACTFALAVAAANASHKVPLATGSLGMSPPASRLLRAARLAALGTCALVVLDVLLLLYAFVSHDFRIRYVMRYSDRSMPAPYLFTALWGGQDGSLLWWAFLLSAYTGACVLWLKNRYQELAPYVIATLMTILFFFAVLMAFAANPFSANVAGAPPDGDGLNPSLQNFYMAIHPPSLYIGFVGCAVPFAFGLAALLSNRLDDEWIHAARRWALFAWLFLSIGNILGMLWAYEELGWGGYWAWDPVENAACMPWFTMTAYLHSVMVQERRRALKIWNLVLLILTFLLTIFGTFLTRSGLIASIHSFAQSEIGTYFLYFLAFCTATSFALVLRRLPQLRSSMEIDSVLSREAMFVANNWILLGICVFIVVATTWPKISEAFWNERLTVGASFYNFWLPVPGLVMLALIGVGTLTPWRKASEKLLWNSFRGPLLAAVVVAVAHILFGARLGYPAYAPVDPIYPSAVGRAVAWIDSRITPISLALVAFNVAAVVQEFYRGAKARMASKQETSVAAFANLVLKNRRRYGGYTVHMGLALMFLGFTGSAWRQEGEASLRPGETFAVGRYTMRYDGMGSSRDPNKREVWANISVWQDGRPFKVVRPSKRVYTTHPDMPTSEVSITAGLRDDLYVVLASVNENSRIAHLKGFVNPLTLWIWLGGLLLVIGLSIAIWPEVTVELLPQRRPDTPGKKPEEPSSTPNTQPSAARSSTGAALALLLTLAAGTLLPSAANAQGHTGSSPPPVGGESETLTPEERRMFDRLLCMCGTCQRLPLATCTCDFASHKRASMRERLANGTPADQLVSAYVAEYGAASLAVPPDQGYQRGVYALPIAVAVGGGALAGMLLRSWKERRTANSRPANEKNAPTMSQEKTSDYDRRIDEELRGLDD